MPACHRDRIVKLYVRLLNPEAEAAAIAKALTKTSIKVGIEAGQITLLTDTFVQGNLEATNYPFIREIWLRVHELIAIINGAGLVEGGVISRLNLLYVDYENSEGKRAVMPNVGDSDIVLPALRTSIPDPSPFVALALNDRAVAKTLRLFVPDSDWVNLYRIFEIIRHDIPIARMEAAGWATKKEIRAFTLSANDPAITGDFARHGKLLPGVEKPGRQSPPKPAQPNTLSLAMARHLVGRLLRAWLNHKVAVPGP